MQVTENDSCADIKLNFVEVNVLIWSHKYFSRSTLSFYSWPQDYVLFKDAKKNLILELNIAYHKIKIF